MYYIDGMKRLKWTWWYENGQKKLEGNTKDGNPDGNWTSWFENGPEISYSGSAMVVVRS